MKSIHVKQGYQPVIAGAPSSELVVLGRPDRVAVIPEAFPFVKPRLAVKEGDPVRLGSVLFADKKYPDLVFRSPGGGVIESIVFGKRRVVQEIRVLLDAEEERESFPIIDAEDLARLAPSDVGRHLLEGGLWPLFRELPCRNIPKPGTLPDRIYVNVGTREPLACRSEVWLKDWVKAFEFGVQMLKALCPEVHIYANEEDQFALNQLSGTLNLVVFGKFPANDPGVVHYGMDAPEGNSWFIQGQDVLLLAHLFETGTYPGDRTYAVGGSLVENPCHVRARYGSPISFLLRGSLKSGTPPRFVSGGLFSGTHIPEDGFMGPIHTALAAIPEGKEKEFFGFVRLGATKPSASRTFLSAFSRNRPRDVDCNTHGELRACVNCGHCEPVCPVDILPQFTMKALHAGEIEDAIEHGLLDCIECGLCSYVCPSKIDLARIFASARQTLFKEQETGA